jgi:archaellum biogenesis ATPase FlaH
MSIPQGNTVAVAGDPGTGKTTLLLTFLRYGKVNTKRGIDLRHKNDSTQTDNDEALKTFDDLIQPTRIERNEEKSKKESGRAEAPKTKDNGSTLRILISLENSFDRIFYHHHSLLPSNECAGNGDGHKCLTGKDLFVFIDATSFLSGRLEDQLRYPRLFEERGNGTEPDGSQRPSAKKKKDWAQYNFVQGGWAPNTDAQTLYWQVKDKEPKSIDHLASRDRSKEENDPDHETPFPPYCGWLPPTEEKDGGDSSKRRSNLIVYNLMTPPLPDPQRRVRLLKDLLATLFAQSRNQYTRLLAIDSLSALLSPMHDMHAPETPAQHGRRLQILNMVRWLEEHEVTSLMACEAVRESAQTMNNHPLFLGTQERYIASGVIQLDYHQYGSGDLIRYLRVLKMRGAGHDMRSHAYDLDANGLSWLEPLVAEPEHGQ